MTTAVRIQFSRDINPSTLKGRVQAHYQQSAAAGRDQPVAPPIDVTLSYAPANRVLEVHFAKPLERFQTVKVELLDGILVPIRSR